MATANRGFLIPVVLTITFVMLATPTVAVRSSLLSSLLNNKASDNNRPLVLVLDNSVLSKGQLSNVDSDLIDLNQRNDKALPYVLNLLNQQAQSKNRDSKFGKPSKQRDRRVRFQKHNKLHNRHRHHEAVLYNNARHRNYHTDDNRNRDTSLADDDEYRGRGGRYQQRKQRYRSNRHLRTDDKQQQQDRDDDDRRDQDQDREDRKKQDREQPQNRVDDADQGKNERPKSRVEESAQDQIPVIKSLLRSVSCAAKSECQDSCDDKYNGKKKDACEDKCEQKYDECDEESEEDTCGNSCEESTTKNNCNGSTKGPPLPEPEKYCKRC